MADLIMKQARAIVDDRTTVICLDVHGSIMPVDQAFETLAGDFMSPPFHVHCRTLVGPYMKGFVQEARKAANAELMKRPKSERRKGPDGPAGSIPGPVTGNPPSGFSRRDDTDLSDAELFNAKLPEVKAAPVKIKRDPGRYEPKVQYGKATDEWGEDRASEIALTAQRVNIMLHGLTPEAKQVPIVHQSMKRAMELGSFDPVKKQILLDYTAPGAISTLVHEMGHMTDHMILNEGRQGSAIDAVLRYDDDHPLEAEIRAWWDAIEMSVSGDQILQAFYSRDGDETASYLAEHQEFFARSYAQWGLDKMGDSAGKATQP